MGSIRHPLVRALLGLTLVTGMVDAVSFLALGSVFTANQTGNVILLGLGIAGTGGLEVLAPLLSLGFFLLGALAGGLLAGRLAGHHPRHMAASVGLEVALIVTAALFAAVVEVRANDLTGDIVIVLLALAMGMRTATCRGVGVPDLSTTVVTMAMTGLMADSALAGGRSEGRQRRAAVIVAILIGAVAGALLLEISDSIALAAAALLSLVILLAYLPAARAVKTS